APEKPDVHIEKVAPAGVGSGHQHDVIAAGGIVADDAVHAAQDAPAVAHHECAGGAVAPHKEITAYHPRCPGIGGRNFVEVGSSATPQNSTAAGKYRGPVACHQHSADAARKSHCEVAAICPEASAACHQNGVVAAKKKGADAGIA